MPLVSSFLVQPIFPKGCYLTSEVTPSFSLCASSPIIWQCKMRYILTVTSVPESRSPVFEITEQTLEASWGYLLNCWFCGGRRMN